MAEVLRATGLSKAFGGTPVVKDISLSLQEGEIFGLIGPNGAGKTTVIRMLLHMIQPDAGEVAVFSRPLDSEARDRIGYLPEERGLYKQTSVLDVMAYMARLKGLSRRDARTRSIEVLEQLGMGAHGRKKVSELSRGMRQLVQFGATVIHEPDLVILDEPFSGLYPVNTEHLKGLVSELQRRGAAVIFSTHQMNAVEELCDGVLMVHRGEAVLYGPVEAVKERYRKNSLFIHWDGPRDSVRGIERWEEQRPYWEAYLADGTSPEVVLEEILRLGGSLKRFQVSSPSLNEVFIQVVQERGSSVE